MAAWCLMAGAGALCRAVWGVAMLAQHLRHAAIPRLYVTCAK